MAGEEGSVVETITKKRPTGLGGGGGEGGRKG